MVLSLLEAKRTRGTGMLAGERTRRSRAPTRCRAIPYPPNTNRYPPTTARGAKTTRYKVKRGTGERLEKGAKVQIGVRPV